MAARGVAAKRKGGHHPRREGRDLARREFIEGPGEPTVAALARKHGYNPKALHVVSSAEGWVRRRAEHRRELEAIRRTADRPLPPANKRYGTATQRFPRAAQRRPFRRRPRRGTRYYYAAVPLRSGRVGSPRRAAASPPAPPE